MKKLIIFALSILLMVPAIAGARKKYGSHSSYRVYDMRSNHGLNRMYLSDHGSWSLDWDGDRLVIESYDFDNEAEITDDFELFINGDKVKLNKKQKSLVREFYKSAENLQMRADAIGEKGRAMGRTGGIIGPTRQAQAQLSYAMARTNYRYDRYDRHDRYDDDSDDLEEAMEELEERMEELEEQLEAKQEQLEEKLEAMTEGLEEAAEELEEAAEELEDAADDVQDLFDEILDEIPEMDDIDWED